MPEATLRREDATLAIHEHGEGFPVVFQHGLGGDAAQVAQTFPPGLACRRLTLECRGHGRSELGRRRPFSFEMFADDIIAAADRAGLQRFVVGGISMGAGLALRLACRHPGRVTGLILVRPAWLFADAPDNLAPIVEVADLIRGRPLAEAHATFMRSETAARLGRDAPDNLASLLGYFDPPNAGFADVLHGIASGGPGVSERDAAALAVPTLVIGNELDAIHPLPMAKELAAVVPGATFREVFPKATDKDRHFAEVQETITAFLGAHFNLRRGVSP